MRSRKLIHTVLAIVIAGIAITGFADNLSQTYAEDALKRALATFAVSRTLNGVISVAQGTEIALEPGGVGVMLTPGQILDPVNDLVERFSSVMLVAASSLGLQLILLEILSWWLVTGLLVAALAVWLATLWSPALARNRFVSLTIRLTLVLTIVRFAVPVVIIATNLLFDAFLLSKHDQATSEMSASALKIEELHSQMDDTAESADQVAAAAPPESTSGSSSALPDLETWASNFRNSASSWYSGVTDWFGSMNISARFEELEETATQATSHIINLIVIFVLQTIIFPLVFLWAFVETLKGLAGRSMSAIGGNSGNTPAAG